MFCHLHSCLTKLWDVQGLNEVSYRRCSCQRQLETIPILATTEKKRVCFFCSFLVQLESEASRKGERVLFFRCGRGILPKFLFREYFCYFWFPWGPMNTERDFCDNTSKNNKKPLDKMLLWNTPTTFLSCPLLVWHKANLSVKAYNDASALLGFVIIWG